MWRSVENMPKYMWTKKGSQEIFRYCYQFLYLEQCNAWNFLSQVIHFSSSMEILDILSPLHSWAILDVDGVR